MKDFTNSYIALALNKVKNTIIDKITYAGNKDNIKNISNKVYLEIKNNF